MAINKPTKLYTCEDYYNLPENERAELYEGVFIYNMAPPSRAHQKILNELSYTLNHYIKTNNGSCEVYPAPFAVKLSEENNTIVEPDISVICDKNKLDDKGCNGAPDFVIEITSTNAVNDYVRKLNLYQTYGVREYWIVNPDKKIITVYNFDGEFEMSTYTFDDKIKVGIYENFYIDFSEINKIL